MFKDEATIEVIAGDGGDGLVSFRHEKYAPLGGPNGGDGGRGGSVILHAVSDESSLLRVGRRHRYQAPNGRPGGPNKCYGRSGADLHITVPVGTLVYDAERGNLLKDLAQEGLELVVAQGGKGGKGNVHFANAVKQTPRVSTPGKPGESRGLRLELKIVADVGLIGLPNAGKSSFLSVVTAARPKVADYPFTTLSPQVGIAMISQSQTLCVADLPGLIEGAAGGTGLGHQFLRHVERCRVLLHLVDVSPFATLEPQEAWRSIEAELEAFSPVLAAKPRLAVATKVEDERSEEGARELEEALGMRVWRISSLRKLGLRELLGAAYSLVHGEERAP